MLILEAKSYVIEGNAQTKRGKHGIASDAYAQATTIATNALPMVSDIQSEVNLTRINHLWEELAQTEFGKKSIEVATLEVHLISVTYPALFQ